MSLVCFQDGEWKDETQVLVSGFSLGVSRGLSVFETMRTYDGRPFMVGMHLDRMRTALSVLSITGFNMSDAEVEDIINIGIKKNNLKEAAIKLLVVAGDNEGMLSSSTSSVMIQFLELSLPDPETYKTGVRLISMQMPRTLPEYKTTNYTSAKVAMMQAAKIGATDVIYLDGKNNVLETTISNLFMFDGSKWVTPPKEGILNGVTRQLILMMLTENHQQYEERTISLDEVKTAKEVLICSSIKEILGVNELDGTVIGAGVTGKHTLSLADSFKQFAKTISG